MARVTIQEVKDIFNASSAMTDATITACITIANLMITDNLSGYEDEYLKEIERWLSAHFCAVNEQQAIKKKIGDAETTYHGMKTGEGLKSTIYGLQVVAMDTSGVLVNLGKVKATVSTIDY